MQQLLFDYGQSPDLRESVDGRDSGRHDRHEGVEAEPAHCQQIACNVGDVVAEEGVGIVTLVSGSLKEIDVAHPVGLRFLASRAWGQVQVQVVDDLRCCPRMQLLEHKIEAPIRRQLAHSIGEGTPPDVDRP